MLTTSVLVYIACTLTSLLCFLLLARGYRRTRTKLLFWSAVCFAGLALNNFLLSLDILVFSDQDLRPLRTLTVVGSLAVLLYGFIWKRE